MQAREKPRVESAAHCLVQRWGTQQEIVHRGVWKGTCSSVDQPFKRVEPQQQAITKGLFGSKTCWRTAFSYLVGSPHFPPPQAGKPDVPEKQFINWCNRRQLIHSGKIWYCCWLCSHHRHPAPWQWGSAEIS